MRTTFGLALLVGGAATIGLTGNTQAADLPVYKAAPKAAATVYNWTGFYVGGHAGYGWGEKEWTDPFNLALVPPGEPRVGHKTNGALGGLQAGFNYQIGHVVFGIEGDWSWTGLDGGTSRRVPEQVDYHVGVDWLATLTGRLGMTTGHWLFYVKGGAAWADDDYTLVFTDLVVDVNKGSGTRRGWIIGAGAEYDLGNSFSVKLEYNYLDFGSETVTLTRPGVSFPMSIDQDIHAVKFGINYRFGAGKAPVVAKY